MPFFGLLDWFRLPVHTDKVLVAYAAVMAGVVVAVAVAAYAM